MHLFSCPPSCPSLFLSSLLVLYAFLALRPFWVQLCLCSPVLLISCSLVCVCSPLLLFIVVFVLYFLSALAWGPFWMQLFICCIVILFSCFFVCVFSCSLVHRCACPLVLLLLRVFITRPLHGARLVNRFLVLSACHQHSSLAAAWGPFRVQCCTLAGLQTEFKSVLMSCTLGLSSNVPF